MLLQDTREPIARLSELTQRDGLNLAALDRKLESVQGDVKALLSKPGVDEARFISEYDPDAEIFKGIQVLNVETEEYAQDRKQYLEALTEGLKDPALDLQDPISLAQKRLFDFVKWEKKVDRHADYFQDALQPLSSHFRVIFTRTFGENFLFRLERE
jgi:hypothetical protein